MPFSSEVPPEVCYTQDLALYSACPFGSTVCNPSTCVISSDSAKYFIVASCSAPACNPVPPISNAVPTYSRPLLPGGLVAEGTTATYACNPGFEESHSYSIQCSDGNLEMSQTPDISEMGVQAHGTAFPFSDTPTTSLDNSMQFLLYDEPIPPLSFGTGQRFVHSSLGFPVCLHMSLLL